MEKMWKPAMLSIMLLKVLPRLSCSSMDFRKLLYGLSANTLNSVAAPPAYLSMMKWPRSE